MTSRNSLKKSNFHIGVFLKEKRAVPGMNISRSFKRRDAAARSCHISELSRVSLPKRKHKDPVCCLPPPWSSPCLAIYLVFYNFYDPHNLTRQSGWYTQRNSRAGNDCPQVAPRRGACLAFSLIKIHEPLSEVTASKTCISVAQSGGFYDGVVYAGVRLAGVIKCLRFI